MGKSVTVSGTSHEYGTFLFTRNKYPSVNTWTETEHYVCDICGEVDDHVFTATELLHVPSLRYQAANSPKIRFRNVEYGHKGHTFLACDTHTDLELDKKINQLKLAEHKQARGK